MHDLFAQPAQELILRDYQLAALEAARENIRKGIRRQILCAPTGAGKTIIALGLMQRATEVGARSAFLVDRSALVDQSSTALDLYGIDHGVMQADHWRSRPRAYVQLVSAQTLGRRLGKGGYVEHFLKNLRFVLIDEAHTLYQATLDWLDTLPENCSVIGLTATPFTRGLGRHYQAIVNVATTDGLIESGNLVKPIVFAAVEVDASGVAVKSTGEWDERGLEREGIKIVGDVVTEYIKRTTERYGGPVKTICFSSTVAHGEEICRAFAQVGLNFQNISYHDDEDERRAKIAEFRKAGSLITGLVSCDALAKGFDVPDVKVCILCRPLRKSLTTHIQQIGRVMRPAAGKTEALVIDHCIASGSRVLTQRGLVPIEEILITDTLWDGREFVAHKGVISRGVRPVIRYAGLTATPDHPVKTAQGWRSLGECAEEQTGIVTTGVGRTALRERDGHFTAGGMARAEAPATHACSLRMRHLWVSFRDRILKSYRWADERLSALQSAKALPDMAVSAGRRDETALHESERTTVRELRRARDRISLRFTDFVRSLDRGELAFAAQCAGVGVGSEGQQRALRARQFAVGDEAIEQLQSAQNQMDAADTQVSSGTSKHSIFRRYLARTFGCWLGFRANHNPVQPAVVQAERQVWDILEAGPRNSFTCEGLLVHNSGNVLRFLRDTVEFWANGVDELNEGAEKDKVARTIEKKERTELVCFGCQAVMPPAVRVCPACGRERPAKPSGVTVISGTTQQIDMRQVSGRKFDYATHPILKEPAVAYQSFLAFTTHRKHGDEAAGRRWAAGLYKGVYGEWPPRTFDALPHIPEMMTFEVESFCRREMSRYSKRRDAV